jgi:hypothetical protein
MKAGYRKFAIGKVIAVPTLDMCDLAVFCLEDVFFNSRCDKVAQNKHFLPTYATLT